MTPDQAKDSWESQFNFSFGKCSHANWNGKCKKIEEGQECLQGMRLRQYHMLCGALLRVWKRVADVVSDITSSSILQIVRLKTKNSNKQVGEYTTTSCNSHTHTPSLNVLANAFFQWPKSNGTTGYAAID